jgi:hypothetical protein
MAKEFSTYFWPVTYGVLWLELDDCLVLINVAFTLDYSNQFTEKYKCVLGYTENPFPPCLKDFACRELFPWLVPFLF